MFFILSKLLPWLLSPPVWLMGLLLGALTARTPRRRTQWLRAAVVLAWVGTNPFLVHQAWLAWEVPPVPLKQVRYHDVAIVLTGITNSAKSPHDRVYVPRGADRVLHTLLLWRRGQIGHILITGGEGTLLPSGRTQTEADELRVLLKLSGVPDSVIVVETRARNTRENALFSAKILQQHPGWGRPLLVTSAFHIRRAVGCFQQAGVAVDAFPVDFYTTDQSWTPDATLLPAASALYNWTRLIHELLGYVTYSVMGYV